MIQRVQSCTWVSSGSSFFARVERNIRVSLCCCAKLLIIDFAVRRPVIELSFPSIPKRSLCFLSSASRAWCRVRVCRQPGTGHKFLLDHERIAPRIIACRRSSAPGVFDSFVRVRLFQHIGSYRCARVVRNGKSRMKLVAARRNFG